MTQLKLGVSLTLSLTWIYKDSIVSNQYLCGYFVISGSQDALLRSLVGTFRTQFDLYQNSRFDRGVPGPLLDAIWSPGDHVWATLLLKWPPQIPFLGAVVIYNIACEMIRLCHFHILIFLE
jgi:hypothetical protein